MAKKCLECCSQNDILPLGANPSMSPKPLKHYLFFSLFSPLFTIYIFFYFNSNPSFSAPSDSSLTWFYFTRIWMCMCLFVFRGRVYLNVHILCSSKWWSVWVFFFSLFCVCSMRIFGCGKWPYFIYMIVVLHLLLSLLPINTNYVSLKCLHKLAIHKTAAQTCLSTLSDCQAARKV